MSNIYSKEFSIEVRVFVPVHTFRLTFERFGMTLNYWVIVKRNPFTNGVVGGSIPAVKSSLYLTEKNKAILLTHNMASQVYFAPYVLRKT